MHPADIREIGGSIPPVRIFMSRSIRRWIWFAKPYGADRHRHGTFTSLSINGENAGLRTRRCAFKSRREGFSIQAHGETGIAFGSEPEGCRFDFLPVPFYSSNLSSITYSDFYHFIFRRNDPAEIVSRSHHTAIDHRDVCRL